MGSSCTGGGVYPGGTGLRHSSPVLSDIFHPLSSDKFKQDIAPVKVLKGRQDFAAHNKQICFVLREHLVTISLTGLP